MRTYWLALLGLLVAAPSFAAAPNVHQDNLRLCHENRQLAPQLWQAGAYEVPSNIPPLMLDALDGKTSQVVAATATMRPEDAQRWRQLAMYTAATAGKSATVDVLLNHGADVDGSALMPSFKPAFYENAIAELEHHPPFNAKIVQSLEAKGLVNRNDPQQTSPAIYLAITCNDLATVQVLLRHHADPMRPSWPSRPPSQRGSDPFLTAIVGGDAGITQTFLDHGANACVEDARIADFSKEEHHPLHTIADIGRKADLPSALVQRLTCHAPSASN